MDGIVVTYALSSPQTTASANIDPVQNSRHDLVLYTYHLTWKGELPDGGYYVFTLRLKLNTPKFQRPDP